MDDLVTVKTNKVHIPIYTFFLLVIDIFYGNYAAILSH